MKYNDKNKESSYLKYWDINNLYGGGTSQKLPSGELQDLSFKIICKKFNQQKFSKQTLLVPLGTNMSLDFL